MTEVEIRICRAVHANAIGRTTWAGARTICNELLRKPSKDLSDYHRDWLLNMAWQVRDKLPGDLAVIVALKRGGDL